MICPPATLATPSPSQVLLDGLRSWARSLSAQTGRSLSRWSATGVFERSPYRPPQLEMSDHLFRPVAGHPDDDECTYTDGGVYCGAPEAAHKWSER